jgi:hypothetical protein
VAPDQPYCIPAKAYDYIGAGTRVLAVCDGGATSDLIRSTGVGEVFDPADVEGIKDFIHRSISDGDLTDSRDKSTHQLDRKTITGELAKHLDRITDPVRLKTLRLSKPHN